MPAKSTEPAPAAFTQPEPATYTITAPEKTPGMVVSVCDVVFRDGVAQVNDGGWFVDVETDAAGQLVRADLTPEARAISYFRNAGYQVEKNEPAPAAPAAG
jgi:hypothetical protein